MKEFANIYVKIITHVEHIESAHWISEVKESASDRRKREDIMTVKLN